MAKNTPARKTAAAPAASAPRELTQTMLAAALIAIAAATLAPPHFTVIETDIADKLAGTGHIDINPTVAPDAEGKVQVRATPAGLELAKQLEAEKAVETPAGETAGFGQPPAGFGAPPAAGGAAATGTPAAGADTAAAGADTAAEKPVFKIAANIPMPEAGKRGNKPGNTLYPFDSLEVGQAFFIAATVKRPTPHSSLTSTVNTAQMRHAVATGKMVEKKAKDGTVSQVPEMKKTREFALREVKDGSIFGAEFAGKYGAGVWRTA